MPIDHEVDVEHGAVGEADALDAVAALDQHHPDAEAHVDAVVAVHVGHDRAHLGPEARARAAPGAPR